MTSLNPKHKPLHRQRKILNAQRNAERFPQLAESLFDPAHALANFYTPEELLDPDSGWHVVPDPSKPPQATMYEHYRAPDVNRRPVRSTNEADRYAQHLRRATAGFVPYSRNGIDQFERLLQLGLDPREPPTEEELRRREENEAKVQVFRDKMTLQTIMENSGGKQWKKESPFPNWNEALARQMKYKSRLDIAQAEKEAEAKIMAKKAAANKAAKLR